MVGASKILEAYGLGAAGYEVMPGEAKDWIANFKQAVSEQRWLVIPLWQPQWINAACKVRVLDEPKGIYGKGDAAVVRGHETACRNSNVTGSPRVIDNHQCVNTQNDQSR
jgi:glycine betaine/proline transport system substrate-binding protein